MSDTDAPVDAPVDAAALAEQSRENVDAWISGDPAKMEWANRPDNGVPDWKPGDRLYVPDPQKDAEEAQAAPFVKAATTLSQLGPEGEALVQEWGGHTSQDFQENIAYARDAFREIAANRPDLIAKVDASGLGNDPAVLKLLAQHGRMQANNLGDFTVARNGSSPSEMPAFRGNGSKASAQTEWNKIYKDNPPGSAGYRRPEVQKRIGELAEILSGGGNIVGHGGRTG
jgi:hypothetical protein